MDIMHEKLKESESLVWNRRPTHGLAQLHSSVLVSKALYFKIFTHDIHIGEVGEGQPENEAIRVHVLASSVNLHNFRLIICDDNLRIHCSPTGAVVASLLKCYCLLLLVHKRRGGISLSLSLCFVTGCCQATCT